MNSQLIALIGLALSAVACGLSAWNVVRTGNWRKTDDAKAWFSRVQAVEAKAAKHEDHLQRLDDQIVALPTKADLAALSRDVASLQRQTDNVERGVERIESHLMGRVA